MIAILQMTFSITLSCTSVQILMKVFNRDPIENNAALVQAMVWQWTVDELLPDPMLTQIYAALKG